jgi:hypothetical protein
MAMTHTRAKEVADEMAEVATAIVELLSRAEKVLDKNSDFSIDWANASKPAFLNEDSATNLDGTKFTRAQLANAIGSIDNFRKYLRNEAVSQGDHLGNLNQLADV